MLLVFVPVWFESSYASQPSDDDLKSAVRELTWSTPTSDRTYRYAKKINGNLGHAIDSMLQFKPSLALGYASRCHDDAILRHERNLARLCSAVASAFADAAGRPDIGLYWASEARSGDSVQLPVFAPLDKYLRDNVEAMALFDARNPALEEPATPAISDPSIISLSLHMESVRAPGEGGLATNVPAVSITRGDREARFFIDSGAPSFLSDEAARLLGFSSHGWKVRVNTLDRCEVDLVRGEIGDINIDTMHVARMAMWRSDNSCADYPQVNVLGYDFLYAMRRVLVDYDEMKITLGSKLSKRDAAMQDAACARLGFRFSPILVEGAVSVAGSVRGTPVSVMPDLGNNIGVMITPAAYRRLVARGAAKPGLKVDQKVILPLEIGQRTFAVESTVRENPIGVDVVLSRSFFRKWFFDYEGGEFCGVSLRARQADGAAGTSGR